MLTGAMTAASTGSDIDMAFNRAAAWGKTIQLIVTAGFNSPQWVLD
jgi:hypothetical protein